MADLGMADLKVSRMLPGGRGAGRRGLFGAVLAVALLCVAPSWTRAQEPPRPAVKTLEARTHELVNGHRRRGGLRALEYVDSIAAIARRHSSAMAAGRIPLGHEGARSRWRAIERTFLIEGMAENVAVNGRPSAETAQAAVQGWLESPGHRENIEGDYDATGIGIARGSRGTWYFTQVFVRRRGEP